MVCKNNTKAVPGCNAFKNYLINFRMKCLDHSDELTETQINKLARYYFKRDKTLDQSICPSFLRKRCSNTNSKIEKKYELARFQNSIAHLPQNFKFGDINQSTQYLKQRNKYLKEAHPKGKFPLKTLKEYYELLDTELVDGKFIAKANEFKNQRISKTKKNMTYQDFSSHLVDNNTSQNNLPSTPRRRNSSVAQIAALTTRFLPKKKKNLKNIKKKKLQFDVDDIVINSASTPSQQKFIYKKRGFFQTPGSKSRRNLETPLSIRGLKSSLWENLSQHEKDKYLKDLQENRRLLEYTQLKQQRAVPNAIDCKAAKRVKARLSADIDKSMNEIADDYNEILEIDSVLKNRSKN